MKKFIVRVENNNNYGEEEYTSLDEAIKDARRVLDHDMQNLRLNADEVVILASEEFNEDDEVIDDTYDEHLCMTIEEYSNMSNDDRVELFEKLYNL